MLKIYSSLIIVFCSVLSLFAQDHKSAVTLIKNIKIIDGTGKHSNDFQSVIIENGRFTAIGNTGDISTPQVVTIIDGKGKTMIPGFVGVHNHLHIPGFPFLGETAAKLYLASGVTTIQTCGSASPMEELALAEKIENKEVVGPDIIPSGPYITGKNGNPNMIIPESEAKLRDTIDFWAQKGAKWFKVYRNIRAEDLRTVIEQAHKNGAKVTGHLCSVTFENAARLGIDAIEHGFNSLSDFRSGKENDQCSGSRKYIDSFNLDDKKVDQLLDLLVRKNVVLTSTLSIYESSILSRATTSNRALEIMSPSYRMQYVEDQQETNDSEKRSRQREHRLKRIMEFEYKFHEKGGIIAAGVDAGRNVLPGFGIRETSNS